MAFDSCNTESRATKFMAAFYHNSRHQVVPLTKAELIERMGIGESDAMAFVRAAIRAGVCAKTQSPTNHVRIYEVVPRWQNTVMKCANQTGNR